MYDFVTFNRKKRKIYQEMLIHRQQIQEQQQGGEVEKLAVVSHLVANEAL